MEGTESGGGAEEKVGPVRKTRKRLSDGVPKGGRVIAMPCIQKEVGHVRDQ
jgi:hypothetical protein